jgi:hypothetical protein
MKKFLFVLLLLVATPAQALELLVVTANWCPVCARWISEVPEFYDDIDLPMVKIDITTGIISNQEYLEHYWEGNIKRLYAVPTFIIWDEVNKRELVRWAGYQSEEHWYEMLERAKLKADQSILECEAIGLCDNFQLGPLPQNQPQE